MLSGAIPSNLVPVVLGVALAALVVAAVVTLYTGLRLRRTAAVDRAENMRLAALLAGAPALPVIVRADGCIEAPDRFADWLGLPSAPQYLTDLCMEDAGLSGAEQQLLSDDIVASQKAGRSFGRSLHPVGSTRTLMVRGGRAPAAVKAPGGALLWVFDATDSQFEISRLNEEGTRVRAAFDALTGLIEAAPLPMWYRAADLRLTMVNSAYVHAVEGDNADDVVARGLELVEGSGVGGPLASAVVARDSAKPQMQAMPATIRGQRRMLRVYDVPLPDGGVAGFAIDIEDLEQARSGLKRFVEAQRSMLDRLSAGVVQFAADRSLVFCNQPFQRIFAMRSEWLSDRPEFDRVLERMREANRLPEVRDFPGWKAERRDWFVATDNQIEEQWHLPGGIHLRVVAQPLPDGGLLLIFDDRTEQVQLASARDTLLRVRTATFDNLFEALGVFASDGRLQLWNNRFRAVWDFDEEFLAQHPRVDALAKQAEQKLTTPSQGVLITELVRSATVERQQRGGRVSLKDGRYFEFTAVPLPDGNALFTMLDVSDSRRIERALRDRNEALEAADKVKTAFVANMSYELRTPLTSISGFAEMLKVGLAGELPAAASDYVDAIMESAVRLGALIDDVLDLTLGQKDGPQLQRYDVDLERIAHQAADKMRPLAERKKLDFAVDIQPSTGTISGDARRLSQTIENLLHHAVSGTQQGGRVLLRTDGTETNARIIVSDNGRGMTERAIARAFDRFAEPVATRDGERALGLGLPLARQFVEAHGGTIDLVSERGEGTMITVDLPRQ